MHYRSWLIVPGDSEHSLAEAVGTGSDVIVIDLESSVELAAKPAARQMAAQWLRAHRRQIVEQRAMKRWVRINALDSGQWREDLVSVIPCAPDGIILPKSDGPEAVRMLAAELYEIEQRNQIAPGNTRILPIAGQTPRAAIKITDYAAEPHQRLLGLSWGAENLSAALGATRTHAGRTGWTDAFRHVRTQTLLSAHACGIMPIETFHADPADLKGLKAAASDAAADGFSGMMAVHPDQVPVINAAFAPEDDSAAEAHAEPEYGRMAILRPA
jgi:citrate lyase subunit beta/citryl-CoA lyase